MERLQLDGKCRAEVCAWLEAGHFCLRYILRLRSSAGQAGSVNHLPIAAMQLGCEPRTALKSIQVIAERITVASKKGLRRFVLKLSNWVLKTVFQGASLQQTHGRGQAKYCRLQRDSIGQ